MAGGFPENESCFVTDYSGGSASGLREIIP